MNVSFIRRTRRSEPSREKRNKSTTFSENNFILTSGTELRTCIDEDTGNISDNDMNDISNITMEDDDVYAIREKANGNRSKDTSKHQLKEEFNRASQDEDRGSLDRSSSSAASMDISAPSLYDNSSLYDNQNTVQPLGSHGTSKADEVKTAPAFLPDDLSTFTVTFAPTIRGGNALVVNDCMLRIANTKDHVTYW